MFFLLSQVLPALLLTSSVSAQKQEIILNYNGADASNYGRLICDGCVPKELIVAPGIGFDITSSYANAAVKFHNGSIADLGRVEVTRDFTEVVNKWSPPYRRYGPPFSSISEEIAFGIDQASRRLRKLRGLASTVDIEILAHVLIQLRNLSSLKLQHPVSSIVASLPHLPNLLSGDLFEALEIANLTQLQSYRYSHVQPLFEANAAWAGMSPNHGLCEHYRDIERCDREDLEIKLRRAVLVSFTGNELIVESLWVNNAYSIGAWISERYIEYGYTAAKESGNWNNKTFWDRLGSKIYNVAARTPDVADLVLLGEYAEDEKFQKTLRKALGGEKGYERLLKGMEKRVGGAGGVRSEVLAARGAAEFAKRWLGMTWGCIEGEWCPDRENKGVEGEL